MTIRRVILTTGAVILCGSGVAGMTALQVQVSRPPAVQVQAPASSPGVQHGAKSHLVAKTAASHVARHVVPHRILPHPYLFHRPYIFRVFRSRGGN